MIIGFLFLSLSATTYAQAVPVGGVFELEIDETVAIYGQRAKDCGAAPTFEWTIKKAVSRRPKYGTLSDGGVGERESGRCGKAVPVRIVNYTPDEEKSTKRAEKKKKNIVKDRVTFWGSDRATLLIEVE